MYDVWDFTFTVPIEKERFSMLTETKRQWTLTFADAAGNKGPLTLSNPKEKLTLSAVRTAVQPLIDKHFLLVKSFGGIPDFIGAAYTITSVEDITEPAA